MELTRENFRAMIYYNFWRGFSRQECIDQRIFTFDDEAPSYPTVKRWYNEFNRVRHSLAKEFHKGRPKSDAGPENIKPVQKLIMQDLHILGCSKSFESGNENTFFFGEITFIAQYNLP